MQVGFKVETSLGNEGLFYYPKEDLLATAVILKDVVQLSSADPFERECIFDLRLNPRQTTIQDSAKGEMKIEFDLVIPHK